MKVVAEYRAEYRDEYRRKTLLFFGDSLELIGSAVLMNPGDAKPLRDADKQLVDDFYRHNFSFPDEKIHEPGWKWKEYEDDSTMRLLKEVFDGSRIRTQGRIERCNSAI